MTRSVNRSRAHSSVSSCSASLDLKCAKSPLLLIPVCSASWPMVRPVNPTSEAIATAASRIAALVSSPFVMRHIIARSCYLVNREPSLIG